VAAERIAHAWANSAKINANAALEEGIGSILSAQTANVLGEFGK
jgi:hypothetical protein